MNSVFTFLLFSLIICGKVLATQQYWQKEQTILLGELDGEEKNSTHTDKDDITNENNHEDNNRKVIISVNTSKMYSALNYPLLFPFLGTIDNPPKA